MGMTGIHRSRQGVDLEHTPQGTQSLMAWKCRSNDQEQPERRGETRGCVVTGRRKSALKERGLQCSMFRSQEKIELETQKDGQWKFKWQIFHHIQREEGTHHPIQIILWIHREFLSDGFFLCKIRGQFICLDSFVVIFKLHLLSVVNQSTIGQLVSAEFCEDETEDWLFKVSSRVQSQWWVEVEVSSVQTGSLEEALSNKA